MARARKLEPAVMKIVSATAALPPLQQSSFTFDVSQMVSILNRRFYRQGLQWVVGGIKFTASGFKGPVYTTKLPSTWTMSNAWHKGFASWQRMNDRALEGAESVRPKFLDFKIYANAAHHLAGFDANMKPVCTPGDPALTPPLEEATMGEWESSKIAQPVTGPAVADPGEVFEREIIATGANYPGIGFSGLNAVSLIEGYANSRRLPDVLDPNTPDDAQDTDGATPENWIGSLFNEGTQQSSELIGVLTNENNLAPYPFENDGVNLDTMYPGGENQLSGMEIHDISHVTSTTIGATTRIPGGVFPCGLIQMLVDNTEDTDGYLLLEISLVPGPHRGYLAEPMQDM
ncbi:MAG: hypothetical protein [Circular genetic element sp.]|nr:MAG: hypothetical protein [Circular genetic element sp.]